jgi:serine/threonine protein kinase
MVFGEPALPPGDRPGFTRPERVAIVKMGLYELREVVGKGGMGTVYRSICPRSGRTVAVKVMAPDTTSNPVLLRRFQQEYAAASRLRHPHIVQGLDFGVEAGQPYLVMEFIEGVNLNQRIKQEGPLSESEALRLILQVADALHLAHQHRLVHRDVKPDNILVTRDGQAKLTDLGLIKDLDAGTPLTTPRGGLGTITYTAPEQFADARNADARCDVYGLAATLYFVLTGISPFTGRGQLSILQKKLKSEFVPPIRIVPSLRVAVNDAICKSLDASPASRPGSCRAFADMLTASRSNDSLHPATSAIKRPQALVDPDEQRKALRYPSSLDVSCRIAQDGGHPWDAAVQDVSLTGICLQLDRQFEPGSTFHVELFDEDSHTTSLLTVHVRWVREAGTSKWNVGCAFERELSERELTLLLENKTPTEVMDEGVTTEIVIAPGASC